MPLRSLRRHDHEVRALLARWRRGAERTPCAILPGRASRDRMSHAGDARSPLRGPAGRERIGASARGCTRRGRRGARARRLTLIELRAKPPAPGPPAARGGMAARLLPLRPRPAAGPFLGPAPSVLQGVVLRSESSSDEGSGREGSLPGRAGALLTFSPSHFLTSQLGGGLRHSITSSLRHRVGGWGSSVSFVSLWLLLPGQFRRGREIRASPRRKP